MPFTYEPITPPDRERMESLNIMIGWKKPNARHWTVNRETGDFLVWIAPDREPPLWTRFAFFVAKASLPCGVGRQDPPGNRVPLGNRRGFSGRSQANFISRETGLWRSPFAAVKVYAIADVTTMFANRRKRLQLPPTHRAPLH